MGLDLGTLQFKVQANTDEAKKQVTDFSKQMKDMSDTLDKSGKALTVGLTVPILGAAGASIKLASDLNESINKVDVAFGKNAKGVESWSDTTLNSFGIAKGDALDMAATFGDMATSMGLPTDKAASMSEKLVGLAGDLASFKNISIDEANTALNGVFTGQVKSLEQLGIVMTDANLQQFAYSQGIKTSTDKMTEAQKVQLRYQYVLATTKNSQGDFARTADGTANSMRVAQESIKEAGESFGTNLLPVITPAIQGFTNLMKYIGGLDSNTKNMIMTIAGVVAVVGPVLLIAGKVTGFISAISGAMTMMKTATLAQTAAQYGLNAALLANPITWIVLLIAALVAAFVVLWLKCDAFRNFWITLWQDIQTITGTVVNAIVGFFIVTLPDAWNSVVNFFTGIPVWWDGIWTQVGQFFTNCWDSITNFFTQTIPTLVQDFINIWDNLPYYIGYALGTMVSDIINFGISAWNWVTTQLPKIIQGIITWFSTLPGKIWAFLVTIVNNIATWGTNTYNTASTWTQNTINAVANWFSQLPSRIWNFLVQVVTSVVTWASNLITTAQTEIPKFITTVVTFFEELPGDMLTIGGNIVKGIWNGIYGAATWLKDKIKSFCDGIIDGFKSALKIHSPSQLFADVIGKNMALGIGNGFTNAMSGVTKDMLSAIPNSYDLGVTSYAVGSDLGAYSNSLPVSNNTTTNNNSDINVTINSPKSLSEAETARQFKRTMRELSYGF